MKSLYLNSAVLIKKVFRRESACSVCMLRDKLASKQNTGEAYMKKQKSADKHQLKDDLQSDIKAKLMEMKSQLKEEDEKRQEREKAEQIRKKKEIEKNKSFEELLNESQMDWHQYK
ncbi:Conserved domain protein [Bacillus inaquosorum]